MSASEDSEGDQGIPDFSSPARLQSAQVEAANVDVDESENTDADDEVLLNMLDNDRDSDGDFSSPSNSDPDYEEQKPNLRQSRIGSQKPDGDLIPADLDYEESHYTRPNRHHGPASTWKTWTAEDRAVLAELDSERAQDLSIHLYNAHILKASAKYLSKESSRKRRRGTSEGDHVFRPTKVWTAWPLPADEVPRDVVGSDDRDLRPSKELEECLISTTMKVARERWSTRDWSEQTALEQSGTVEGLASLQDEVKKASNLTREGSEDGFILPRPMFSSQAFDRGASSSEGGSKASSEADDDFRVDENMRPVALADDDEARRLLTPSTRHIISKLDNLLMGLHRARQAYATSAASGVNDLALKSSRGRDESKMSRGRGQIQNHLNPSENAMESDAEHSLVTKGPIKTEPLRKDLSTPRSDRMALRDWSEVLGMASLTGWDQEMVNRASRRCAKLFGQNMLLRTFHEGNENGEKSRFVEAFATGDEAPTDHDTRIVSDPSNLRTDNDSDRSLRNEHPCPHPACPRHTTPFKTYGTLQSHLKKHHMNIGEEDIKPPVAAVSSDASGAVGSAFCPIKTCHKHQTPFSRGSKLYAHVRKIHPEVDVESLKKLEVQRRGENRGRWTDERRRRNPYER